MASLCVASGCSPQSTTRILNNEHFQHGLTAFSVPCHLPSRSQRTCHMLDCRTNVASKVMRILNPSVFHLIASARCRPSSTDLKLHGIVFLSIEFLADEVLAERQVVRTCPTTPPSMSITAYQATNCPLPYLCPHCTSEQALACCQMQSRLLVLSH